MKNSLSSKGLSMSQAQSISNLCNQRAKEISTKLDNINNVSKELTIGDETYIETQGNPIPENVVELLTTKARYSATQAFLMENIKAKDDLINEIRFEVFDYGVEEPLRPREVVETLPTAVDENFGLDKKYTNHSLKYKLSLEYYYKLFTTCEKEYIQSPTAFINKWK